MLWLIRAVYLLILAGAAAKVSNEYAGLFNLAFAGIGPILIFSCIMGIGILAIVLDVMYPRKRIANIAAIYFGLLVGTLLGHLMGLAFKPMLDGWMDRRAPVPLNLPFSLVLTTICCYVCVSILMQTKDDFRFVIPYVEFSRKVKGSRPLILDTSVIIDGRVADLAETGMLGQTIVVPRFVLQELQHIADSQDKMRRSRGRRGLDVLDRLQKCPKVEYELHEEEVESKFKREVDSRLIELAKELNGKLVTNDFNLAKMAKLQDVETININEVSSAAKPPVQWGESLSVRLVKEGEGPGQGIGYMEDGTMVVAEMGRNFVGTEVNLVVTSVLQTNAGRMVFGRIDSKNPEPVKVAPQR